MDNFFANLNQLAERFRELPQNKKVGVLALIAIVVGSLFAMSLWVQAPDYQLLYSNNIQLCSRFLTGCLLNNEIAHRRFTVFMNQMFTA